MRSKASTEAFPATFSAISKIMLPFLYQTRTLANLQCVRSSSISRSRSSNAANRRTLCCSGRTPADPRNTHRSPLQRHRFESSLEDYKEGSVSPVVTRVATDEYAPWKFESRKRAGRGDNFTTIRRQTMSIDEVEEESMEFMSSESIDFDELDGDKFLEESGEIDDLTNPSDSRKARESTITVSERHAFQRIFSDIFALSKQSPEDGDVFTDGPIEPLAPHQGSNAKSRLKSLVSGALVTPFSQNLSREGKQEAVNRYPLALRAAAARAIGLNAEKTDFEEMGDGSETAMDTNQLEQLRQPERERVEALMRAAKTDFELWRVMEDEVFTLVAKLGLQDITPTLPIIKAGKAKPIRKSKKDKPPTLEADTVPKFNTAPGITPLALLGPLYPSHLLLGLRLLDRSFTKPSPLTLSVLPKIKSLGLISQVLGASTALYNEVLRISWFQDDFRGVLSLLTEMEQAGLDFDAETLDIVTDIIVAQGGVARGDRGPTLQLLWTLPEFKDNSGKANRVNQFRLWRHRIRQAIHERNQDIA